MNTLEQDKELLDKLETEYRKEKHQEYHKNKNREQYHPIGLVSDEIRLENKVAFREWMLEIKPTHFFTFNFNKKFQSSNTETIVSYVMAPLQWISMDLLGGFFPGRALFSGLTRKKTTH